MKSLRVFLLSIALLGANGLYSMKLTPSQQMSASISADRLKQITLRFKGGNMPLAAYQDAQRMIKQLEGFGRTEQAADFKKRIDDLTPVSVRQIADRKAIHTKEEPVVEGPKEEPVVEQPVQEPQEEPVVEQPKEEPVVEQPVEQPKVAGQNTYLWNDSTYEIICEITYNGEPSFTKVLKEDDKVLLAKGVPAVLKVSKNSKISSYSDVNVQALADKVAAKGDQHKGVDVFIKIDQVGGIMATKWAIKLVWGELRLYNDSKLDVDYKIDVDGETIDGKLNNGFVLNAPVINENVKKISLKSFTHSKEIDVAVLLKQLKSEKTDNSGKLPFGFIGQELEIEISWE